MKSDLRKQMPQKVDVLEVMLRDGIQNLPNVIPTEAHLWFAERFIKAGHKMIEVTNFSHPKMLPQSRDAEEILKTVWELADVKRGRASLKRYGMNRKAF